MSFQTLLVHWSYPISLCVFSTVSTYVLSIVTSNVSQVDRLWTFLPWLYNAYWTFLPLWQREPLFAPGILGTIANGVLPWTPKELGAELQFVPRAILIQTAITLWMFRLSYNTYRRGLFSLKDEDYRWAVLRAQFTRQFGNFGGGAVFQVVNLTFIAATQNLLLMTLGWPVYLAVVSAPLGATSAYGPAVSEFLSPFVPSYLIHLGHATGLSIADALLALWALGILAVEFTSDNQQYLYQTYKYAFLAKDASSSSKEDKSYASAVKTSSASSNDFSVKNAAHEHAFDVASAVAWPGAKPSSSATTTHFGTVILTPSSASHGFIATGLWQYSRHPNFACEQAFWWVMCGIGSLDGVKYFSSTLAFSFLDSTHFFDIYFDSSMAKLEFIRSIYQFASSVIPFIPSLLLSVLFISSTAFTEAITLSKYPLRYSAFQRRVAMFNFGGIPALLGSFTGLSLGVFFSVVVILLNLPLSPILAPVLMIFGFRRMVEAVVDVIGDPVGVGSPTWWLEILTGSEEQRRKDDKLIWGERGNVKQEPSFDIISILYPVRASNVRRYHQSSTVSNQYGSLGYTIGLIV
ncbi:hypothetical protein BDP27DRAFT_1402219 [Rhodocollybia butyracea]|uniref:Uncharacterized protein n=1 Tax=Rhodocollybia butyracea TaxID=206335 RepID=A0A9P5PVN5_9AGAR|nr:hypothetical protein BDP27DRAFT_1402219 [Rhodocollybia butyracea]